jgi:hypothetical protein
MASSLKDQKTFHFIKYVAAKKATSAKKNTSSSIFFWKVSALPDLYDNPEIFQI